MKFFKEASDSDFSLWLLKGATAGTTIKSSGYQIWNIKGTMPGMGSFTYRMKFSLETDADSGLKKFENFALLIKVSKRGMSAGRWVMVRTESSLRAYRKTLNLRCCPRRCAAHLLGANSATRHSTPSLSTVFE